MNTARRILPLILATVVAGCTTTEPFPMPDRSVEVVIPQHYMHYWQQVDSCSGITRPIGDLRLFVVSLTPFAFPVDSVPTLGLYIWGEDRIVIASGVFAETDTAGARGVIQHEMLHAHLPDPGRGEMHPPEFFHDKCGELLGLAAVPTPALR